MLALIEQWLDSLTVQNYTVATLRTYRQALRPFLLFLQQLDCDDISQIHRQHISDYLVDRLDKDKLAKSSVQHELTVLRQLFKWLLKQGFIHENPTTAHRLKRPTRPLPPLLDMDIIIQLLDQAPPKHAKQIPLWLRDKAMLELLYGSGLRVGELVGLNLSDIDKQQQIVRVLGKGGKTRLVPIGQKSWQALQDYLPYRQLWQRDNVSNSAIFISEKFGKRLTTRTVQLRIKHHAKRANISQNVYPHLLRHCFASHILSDSGDLRGVQELLGHSDISTTQVYTHLDFGHLSKVYDNAHPRSRRS
ncbi:tyrosine recombinase XerC [Moraxella macacae 0408225]|uniref:Tyrosine recombinase XerC n=2 Tax=Moraxella macacae TaxID=765840 RepID=L2F7H6_9GAMM|nr:tyrosine recombinase XerC [Moraxella macacae 0408225]